MSETVARPSDGLIFELESFGGPLDLLLYLIKRDEIDIYDIPIAEITRQYLGYLDVCRELNLEVAGEFLFMASMLIRIKAQMLLPRPEDEEAEDPRNELVNALLEYKRIKEVSTHLESLAALQSKRYSRGVNELADMTPPEPELIRVDIATLMLAFGDVLSRAKLESVYLVRHEEISVDARKDLILALLEGQDSIEFEKLFENDFRRAMMIVTFVAVLELVKKGFLRVEQATRFSQIRLFKVAPVTVEAVETE